MPDSDTMLRTAEQMQERFKLPRFAFAVDGCQVKFTCAPRGLPENKVPQMFWCRKQCYSINVQVTGNEKFICDLDVGWLGSTYDARKKIVDFAKAWVRTVLCSDLAGSGACNLVF